VDPTSILNLDAVGLATVVLRTGVVYLFLLAALRLAGKREIGQMTLFDLVVLLVISNAVQNAMVGPDTSLTAGLVAAATLLALNRLVGTLGLRLPWFQRQVVGSPTLLVYDGALIPGQLAHEGVTEGELRQALREHGVGDLKEVKSAVLEVDGTISVVPAGAPSSRTRRRLKGRRAGVL
jgi:uncharacterized membrane protein YcaP (DUF421 family)